jgi:glutaredoxin
MKKITLYTNETCPYCKNIKEQFTKKNIEFENKLTSDFKDEYQQIVNLIGIPTVPAIEYDGEYFIPGRDFGTPEQLINLLETFESSSYNETRRILERMKTLNYHINSAFGRVDQLLRKIEDKLNIKEDEHESTN